MTTFFLFCGFLGMVFVFPCALAVPKVLLLMKANPDTVKSIDLDVRNALAIILLAYILFLGISPTLMK